MRIALVGPAFPYKGGGARHTTELARRLAAAGHEVVLESWKAQYPGFLYPGQQTIDVPEGDLFPGTHRRLSWRRPDGWYRTGRRLRSYDLVVFAVLSSVQVPAYLGILRGMGRAARQRAVALCHNVLPHEPKPYDRPLMRALLGRVGAVLTHTPEQAALAGSLTDAPVAVAELPMHLPAASQEGAGRVGGSGLLFFGIVRPYKGLDVLLRALPEGVRLTVAGEFWAGLEEARELIGALGLSERVDLRPGYLPAEEIPGILRAADALVLPYRAATASQNVMMAFEHGVPVVATRVGGFAAQIRDGVDGVLAEPDDAASLRAAIEKLLADPDGFRARVVRPDPEPVWTAYLAALTGPRAR
ncbi:glycosyltransferase involved in cell wall biosynthesis [Actinocorallia herbida]|uniref:Glycosyltransferase involved in cell wall biosynthesis n=1 Tax=Actinocorallia herbida TaxID=58109 RepID=A0A3N1D920_9ACTN|nr:glycosyltransferase family 4 protein [Actinocorallia herbida]ROO90037.1 glycosyltransferase involved in cell wall biosynthesis [Actinocorallia herbida]